MKINLGTADRAVRVAIAVVLFALVFVLDGNLRWLAVLGFVPLLTAFAGWCPLYVPFGLSTCGKGR